MFQAIFGYSQDGFLDNTFNTGSGANYDVHVLKQLSDGKILVGGQFSQFNNTVANQLVKLNSDGSIDTSFSSGSGIGDFNVIADAIEDNGKILIVGQIWTYNGTDHKTIVRLNWDGSIDSTFNTGAGAASNTESQRFTLTKQNDKYIVSGTFYSFNGVPVSNIVRLNHNGSVDTTFNPEAQEFGAAGGIYRHCMQSDGKIMIAGGFGSYNDIPIKNIARLNADGTLDTSFDPQNSTNSPIITMAVQPDGKYLINGLFGEVNGTQRFLMARLNTDGSLDDSFVAGTGFGIGATTVIVQTDGKILVGGSLTSLPGNDKFLVRLNSDGSLDESFGDGQGVNNTVLTMSEQQDGKLLVGGWLDHFNTVTQGRLLRLYNHIPLAVVDFSKSGNLFPNPSEDRVSFDLKDTNTRIRVDFFDLFGKLLNSYFFDAEKQMEFDISQYPKGVYLLKFVSEQQTGIRKIIKQ